MDWYNIVSLVVSILSLGATVAVSFVIYHLEGKRQKAEKSKKLERKAREFIQDNISEKKFLSLAQFAGFLNPLYQHNRKIYNAFNRCDIELQKVILNTLNYTDLSLEQYNKEEFVNKLLKLFQEDCKKLNLFTETFLYDGAKYFHRGLYDWGEMRINGNLTQDLENKESQKNYFNKDYYNFYNKGYSRIGEHDIWLRLLDFVNLNNSDDKEQYYKRAKSASSIFYKHKILYSYVVPDSFEEFRDMHKISPLDYYWSLITECAESECCYIVMEMIRNAALIINREMNGEWLHPFECDYEIERNEDLYYCVIQTLFAIYADKLI